MTKQEAKQWVRNRVKDKVRKIINDEPFTPEAIEKYGSKLVKREIYSYRKMYSTRKLSGGSWEPCLFNGENVKL